MKPDQEILSTVVLEQFSGWLDRFGELSYDHQSFFASKAGRAAKALYYRKPLLGKMAVAPIIFCEAFVPSTRRFYFKAQRFPIADAHYAMGFAFLHTLTGDKKYYDRAVHFLNVLEQTRCPGYEEYCWGYPFDWETRNGPMYKDTPLITSVPYMYEAFSQVCAIDKDPKWRRIMRSIADHAANAYRDMETAPNTNSCGYTPAPDDPCGVVNASAYRAFMLTKASFEFSDHRYLEIANKNLNFVLASQNPDGSWYYSMDSVRDFVDHFHTCFVMKALAKIEQLTNDARCTAAITRGVAYYTKHLFDESGLPLPFSRAPRLTVYKRELYDYAECVNLGTLLHGRFPELDKNVSLVISDILKRWHKRDGSFRARELLVGWDNVPMHRWAQSQVFRSLAFHLVRTSQKLREKAMMESLQLAQTAK